MRWKYIEGYGEKYRIYENGTVVSYSPRYLFNGDKKRIADYEPHILNPWHERKGYLMVGLYDENGKVKCVKVHRLVAKAFLPNPENKRCVCHRDNNKENNNVENLYWGSDLENSRQAWSDGLIRTKKPVAQIDDDGNVVRIFDSGKDAEREIGVRQSYVSDCARGKKKKAGGYRWQFI